MKKIIVLLLAMLMLLTSCGAPAETTAGDEVTDIPETNAPETDAPDTGTSETEPEETEKVYSKEDYKVAVKDDTYVYNKLGADDYSNTNFGNEKMLDLKTSAPAPLRYTYLKFDISDLVGDDEITAVDLDLVLAMKQNDPGNPEFAKVAVYSTNTEGWSESTLTFNNQPAVGEYISARDDISADMKGKVISFPVTAYVKKALQEGKTEIAFFLKDMSAIPLHIRFESKESGKSVPSLSVYHGTKIDEEALKELAPIELSENGLDAILGHKTSIINKIDVIEDTYIEAGTSADVNFGDAKILDFKAVSSVENKYYRISLLKFDISDIKGVDFSKAFLELSCTTVEDHSKPVTVNVYTCFAYDWSEKTVTYNTRPVREKLVAKGTVTSTGTVRIDITDYINSIKGNSNTMISFWLEGSDDSVLRLNFASKESGNACSRIVLSAGDSELTTYVSYKDENPWEVAMERVSTWLHRWEKIKQGGDISAKVVEKDPDEFSLNVYATTRSLTNGAKTIYSQYPTRVISKLKGYTANPKETELYDVYGGLMDESMKQEATGFFYTKKIGDRWWTVDPLGYPFFRVAINTISMGGVNQKVKTLAKYKDAETWAQATTDRLKELGFNSAGGWSTINYLIGAEQPMSQTNILYVLKKYCQLSGLDISDSGNTALLYDIMPVFDPEFERTAYKTIEAGVKDYVNSPYIYGWISDNELPHSLRLLDSYLSLDVDDSRFIYTYATAWTFMYMKTGKANVSLSDVTDELRLEFRAMIYDRYFEVVASALDRFAPNHQYIGCRFLVNCYSDEYVMRVAGYWCDVISMNYYGAWDADPVLLANQQKWAGKPVIVTEWYAKGMDVWEKDNRMTNASGAGWTVVDQNARGQFYQNYALSLLERAGCVGFDWFLYWDNDPEDMSVDLSNRNSNKGIIDNDGNEYAVLVEYMEELNNQKYSLIKFFSER